MATIAFNKRNYLRQLLKSDDVYATTLLVLLTELFDLEFLNWTPETIRIEVREELGIELPPTAIDKIMAAIMLLTTDQFFKHVPTFIHICNVLSGNSFDPTVFDPADSLEMAWGITEATLIAPPEEDEPFSEEIRAYMGYQLAEEGFQTAPDVLGIAIMPAVINDPNSIFASDPEIYQAFHEKKTLDQNNIISLLKENLQELLDQLQLLPLSKGSTQELVTKLSKGLAN